MILFVFAGMVSMGVLAPEFAFFVTQIGIFHTEDVTLDGCRCVDSETGEILDDCDELLESDLCPTLITESP
jgi:hypothetical protein